MRAIEVETRKVGPVVVIRPSGRLDSGRVDPLEQAINTPIDEGCHNIAIDFDDTEFIASSALRILLQGRKRIQRQKGAMVLCRMKPHIQALLDTAGFTKMFDIETTLEAAVNSALPRGAEKLQLDSQGKLLTTAPSEPIRRRRPLEDDDDEMYDPPPQPRKRRTAQRTTSQAAGKTPEPKSPLHALGKPWRVLRSLWHLIRAA